MAERSALDEAARRLGERVRRNEPLGPRTTYRVGGPAALFVEASGEDDLAAVRDAVVATGVDVLVVGKGSNLLVADRGFPGLAVALGEAFDTTDIGGTLVRGGGMASLPVVARRTARAGLTGFEWAVGVPGSVGGAVRMNAGGHGSDMAATLVAARVLDLAGGRDAIVRAADLELGYRSSNVAAGEVVLWADVQLRPGDREAAEAEITEIVRWRRAHQPGGQNAGSVFANPPGESAGRLIDAAGCKGLRVGSASVSEKHANFIQADEGGSADDVWRLIEEVRRRVEEQTGIRLRVENRLVGFEGQEGA